MRLWSSGVRLVGRDQVGMAGGKCENGPKRPTRTAADLLHCIITRFGADFSNRALARDRTPGARAPKPVGAVATNSTEYRRVTWWDEALVLLCERKRHGAAEDHTLLDPGTRLILAMPNPHTYASLVSCIILPPR